MLKKISIRWRLTLMSAFLLTVCCIILTFILTFSAYKLVDQIDAAIITMPASSTQGFEGNEYLYKQLTPSIPTTEAKKGYSLESFMCMLFIIIGGSALTYYFAGKVLKPLDILNNQIKSIDIQNLSNILDVPPTKDEVSDLAISFNKMTDKLNDAFIMQQRFSASAAHELRTPLSVLKTKVDVFKKKDERSLKEYDALIRIFEKQINRLCGLIQNLLDMTNMEDDFEQSDIYAFDIFDDIVKELKYIADEKNVMLNLECEDITIYNKNTEQLYRAFYNIIENGIKYNIEGGKVDVIVSKYDKNQTLIQIKDTGIGINDDTKKHIFEPFYRADKSRSRKMGGAGLGLSIVESFISRQNGSITVADNDNGGTIFSIII